MNRLQQLAGIKPHLHENYQPTLDQIKNEIVSLKDKPEELKKWIRIYTREISEGKYFYMETLRIALNIIKDEGIKF